MVAITHPFVNAKADGADATKVRPLNWNAEHTINWEGQEPREQLSGAGALTRYLRFNLGTVEMTIASPAVVSRTAHGLSAGDPVVFSLPFDTPHDQIGVATVTIASPGVWTQVAHGYLDDDPIAIRTTGALPIGLTPTTAGSLTRYFVRNRTDDTYQLSATAGGASINTSGSQSGMHKPERASWLPIGVTEGRVYYVIAAGLTSNQFQFSETVGGPAVNTSGTQAGKITCQTGNDVNDGLSNTRTGALLHVRKCVQQAQALDFAGKLLIYQVADGTYLPDPDESTENNRHQSVLAMLFPVPGVNPITADNWPVGGGRLQFWGNEDFRNNCLWYSPTGAPLYLIGPLPWTLHIRNVTLKTDSGGQLVYSEGVKYPQVYLDHMTWRGSVDWAVLNLGGDYAFHGCHEIMCSIGFMFAWTYMRGTLHYQDPGNSYYPGMVVYEPLNLTDGFYLTQGIGSASAIGNGVSTTGINIGVPWKSENGGHFAQFLSTAGGLNPDPLPGSLPPIIRRSGSAQIRTTTTTGLDTWIQINSDRKRLSADVDKTNDTLADVTEFKFPVDQAGIVYEVDAILFTTSNVAAGVKFSLAGDAVLGSILLEAEVIDGTSIALRERHTVQGTAFGDITAVTAATVRIRGSFVVTTRGFATLQFAQNATNATESTILAGSIMAVVPVL